MEKDNEAPQPTVTNKELKLSPGTIVGDYEVIATIGEGGFGVVYKVKRIKDPMLGALYAMKLESRNTPMRIRRLSVEIAVMQQLKKELHFCRVMEANRTLTYEFLVMTLVSSTTLNDLRRKAPDQKFSFSTTVRVAMQALEALKSVHDAGYVHRDIKPHNLTIGCKETREDQIIFLLDFGMARKGSVRWAPLCAHERKEYYFMGDIESLVYTLVEFFKSKLPWKSALNIDEVKEFVGGNALTD